MRFLLTLVINDILRTIIDTYGLGALSIQRIFGFPRRSEREIIDMEYEDLSDQIESNPQLPIEPQNILQPILLAENYADTNNE